MRYALLTLLLFSFGALFAQAGEITEQTLKYQEQFIAAKRQALLGKVDDAIGRFEALLEEQGDNDAILFELARLQQAAGATDKAIEALRRAHDLRPNEVYAAYLGELYQASGRYADGAELYADLIKRDPDNAEHYLERASFLVKDQEVKEAIATYNALEKRIGVNAELTRRKHALYVASGNDKQAEKELTDLIEAFPKQLEYRHLLASYYSGRGDKSQATKTYREILAIQPADVRAQLALQDTGTGSKPTAGDDRELLALLARADVALDLKIGKLLPLVQKVAADKDRTLADRALGMVAELRRVHPDAAKAAAVEGDLYYHTDRFVEAAAAYRTTIELDDTVFPVWEQFLVSLYLSNQAVLLREYGEEAIDIFPNRPSLYVYYALGEAFRGDFGEADNLLQQARIMVAENAEAEAAMQSLLLALKALENPQAGEQGIKPTLLPGGASAPLARLLALRARPDANILATLDSEQNTNALLLEVMGDAQQTAGNKVAAAELYVRAKAAGSQSPTLSRKLARAKS